MLMMCTLAGTVQDFSIAKEGNADSIVLSGFLKMLVTLYTPTMIGLCYL